MDTNHMTFGDNSFDDIRVFFHVGANHEKSGVYPFCLQDIENEWSPGGVRAIVKGEGHRIIGSPALMNNRQVAGKFVVNLRRKRFWFFLFSLFLLFFKSDASSSVAAFVGYGDKVALANLGYGIAGLDRLEFGKIFLVKRFRCIKFQDVPDVGIFGAEP